MWLLCEPRGSWDHLTLKVQLWKELATVGQALADYAGLLMNPEGHMIHSLSKYLPVVSAVWVLETPQCTESIILSSPSLLPGG